MTERATDPEYLRYQYGDSEKLRIRLKAHERYSERVYDHLAWIIDRLEVRPGQTVVDAGCGPGRAQLPVTRAGARMIGFDYSVGMVREARQQADAQGYAVLLFQADAQAIPLAGASCDRVLAAHMLFHVPDPGRALHEFRRILRSGGRIVITTNAADHAARFHALHAEAARALGYTPTPRGGNRFSLDDIDAVREVFPDARTIVEPNAFVFPTARAALSWYATASVDAIADRPRDGSHRPKLLALSERRIEAIIAREGAFRIPKDMGAFVADV
ncbi:MAG: methyltransferase domain-containing protein [Chloroflexota bacterium]|nr:methyltransferase domain-containing protein [Chloroflexota bacterium]